MEIMLENKKRYILRHESGLYLSWSPDNMPHTRKLSQARRFTSTENIYTFLENSPYAPDKPGEYEIVDLVITYRLEENQHVQQE